MTLPMQHNMLRDPAALQFKSIWQSHASRRCIRCLSVIVLPSPPSRARASSRDTSGSYSGTPPTAPSRSFTSAPIDVALCGSLLAALELSTQPSIRSLNVAGPFMVLVPHKVQAWLVWSRKVLHTVHGLYRDHSCIPSSTASLSAPARIDTSTTTSFFKCATNSAITGRIRTSDRNILSCARRKLSI